MKNICSVHGCNKNCFGKGYCSKHYQQIVKYGEIKRTIYDPNEFIIEGDICWVILYNKQCKEVARAKFYTIYYEQIRDSKLKWHLDGYGYATASWYNENNEKQYTTLHEAIFQLSDQKVPNGYMIDHKDRNILNCLDDNLRICTKSQNAQNQKIRIDNTSGWKGVSWCKDCADWLSYITFNTKMIILGHFNNKLDAARAYNVAAIKYFGEFAKLNEIS